MSSAFTLVISASAFLAYKIAAEMRTMQESLYALFKKLEQAENDKQKYVMAVVHEIKQPVSAVISLLRIIDQKILGELPAPAEDKVKRAIQRCSEAIDTINNVLKFSRMKLLNELNIEEIDPAHLIEDIFAQYSEQIAEKKLSTETVVKTEILRIKGDSFLLRLAISNLIGNAIKYNIESGKILCAISMKDDEIHLSIEDSGIGIPQGELENVNQQFFRSKQIIGTIEGSGVGLAAVRKIIDLHKGTLAISSPSKLGTDQHPGTIITVILPVA
jgi:signal transduction histidine kinase